MSYHEVLKNSGLSQILETNGIAEISHKPELINGKPVYHTDVEGLAYPLDHAAEIAKVFVMPPEGNPAINYGGILFDASYHLYTDWTWGRRKSEYVTYLARNGHDPALPPLTSSEGTDIAFLMPFLLASDVHTSDIHRLVSQIAQPIPGAKEHFMSLKRKGFSIIASTTSFRKTTELIFKKDGIPVDHIIGTPLSLDEAEDLLRETRRYNLEKDMVISFLDQATPTIEAVQQEGYSLIKGSAYLHLLHQLAHFYQNELGLSFDPNLRQNGIECPTLLGAIIENTAVVTDLKKGEGADLLNASGLLICAGDGLNDRFQLAGVPPESEDGRKKTRWSIATNGPDAIRYADIGYIGETMKPLTDVVDCIKEGQKIDANIEEVVREAQYRVGNAAVVHVGGRCNSALSTELIELHKEGKRRMRGDLFIP